jgi:long-chain acyl-CoA synthetase
MLVGDILTRAARLFPSKQALAFGTVRLSYREFDEAANRLANGLTGRGVASGDRVAILAQNCHQYEIAEFGILKAGAAVVPINFRLNAGEIRSILNHAGVRAVIATDDYLDLLQSERGELETVKDWISLTPGTRRDPGFDRIMGEASANPPSVRPPEDGVAFIFYTSGTTGRPKGATITHRNLTASAMIGALELRVSSDEVALFSIPLFHGGGGSAPFGFFLMGATVVVAQWDPDRIAAIIERERVRTAVFVPAMILTLLDSSAWRRSDLSSLKRIADGAAPMPTAPLRRAIGEWGIDFYNVYGLAETALYLSVLHPEDYGLEGPAQRQRRLGSVGHEAVGVDIRIVDDAGNDVPAGMTGEVIARGANVTAGYLNAPGETAAAIRDGWFHTGDVAMWDEDRYLFIVDRKKDIIISGGENISSVEVEEVLSRHPAVREAAVIGVPDDHWGEAVKAIVVLRDGMTAEENDLIEHCRQHLASFKKPRTVEFMGALPRNPAGKVLKNKLREPYWQGYTRRV